MSASIDVKVLNTADFAQLAGALGFDPAQLSYAAAVGRDDATTLFLAERDNPETVTGQGLSIAANSASL